MLVLAATPIGNLQDASPRLRDALADAAVIAAEDTRTTKQLLRLLGIETRAKIVPLHDHNESAKAAELAGLAAESDVVLVSDAGMPTVSDPGFKVVAAAVAADVQVSVVPGPSAPIAALAISGLPSNRFAFEGFVPQKQGERRRFLAELRDESRTLIFFESPHRLHATLQDMAQHFGAERQAAVCREITKMYEQVLRGSLAELAEKMADGVKGEIVVVVAGAQPAEVTPCDALSQVQLRVSAGERLKDATRAVAATTGIPARELYSLALAATDAQTVRLY
ncbi:MAG: 16S rRNA (cytidine(1402)-2'-O)-methyltransferase [Microbacteriaceae bacterium]|nr:16S rRNA (cytidine(1402)-2'-O)-methyltransferase [Microbacteriaceae bacterium]